jgi:hypothetical protein
VVVLGCGGDGGRCARLPLSRAVKATERGKEMASEMRARKRASGGVATLSTRGQCGLDACWPRGTSFLRGAGHDRTQFELLNSDETETVFPIQSNAMTDSTTLPPNNS